MKRYEFPTDSNGHLDIVRIEEDACDAKSFKNSDGIEGVLKLSGKRPYRKLYFEATAKGRRHPKYLEMKRKLHDDWSTDVSGSEPDVWSDYVQRALRTKFK